MIPKPPTNEVPFMDLVTFQSVSYDLAQSAVKSPKEPQTTDSSAIFPSNCVIFSPTWRTQKFLSHNSRGSLTISCTTLAVSDLSIPAAEPFRGTIRLHLLFDWCTSAFQDAQKCNSDFGYRDTPFCDMQQKA